MDLEQRIEGRISHLKDKLTNHRLYKHLKDIEDVKRFTQYHVFAVWDFMSLLKALQNSLTCTKVPWVPNKNSNTARFINEIVLGEETDLNSEGKYKSHFDMYIDAMRSIDSDTSTIESFIKSINGGAAINDAMNLVNADNVIKEFVDFTFKIIDTKKDHMIASAFAFGREGMIAEMFIEILTGSSQINNTSYKPMIYYLERHIELDGDEHGPMAMKMISELCDDDESKIEETISVAEEALKQRIYLWDRITDDIAEIKS